MKNLQAFSANQLTESQANDTKGGLNIFCEIYIGRQTAKGEAIDTNILGKLMEWDTSLNNYLAKM